MSSNRGRRILFVHGLTADTRARELAREFERYGPIVRCDVPPPRPGSDPRSVYAFVEYEDSRDAEDAYDRLHDKRFGEGRIRIQWAKRGPEPMSRRRDGNDRRGNDRNGSDRSRNDRNERDRGDSGRRGRSRPRSRGRSQSRSRSRSPVQERRGRSHNRSRSQSPPRSPPVEAVASAAPIVTAMSD